MKVLVIGLNPSKLGGKSPTLKRLKDWFDNIGLKRYSFTNVYNSPGKFSLKDVRKDELLTITKHYTKVIALGSKVSDILNLMGISHFKIPHPSGLNRQTNNSKFVNQELFKCREYILRDLL